jgi:chemotaxis signal transduction protein
MLKTPPGPSSKERKICSVLLFRVGGRLLAAQSDEVGGVWPWEPPVSVPSQTPCVNGLVRRGEEILAVFDLAAHLHETVRGSRPLCLIVRHCDGPMAICIDETVPSLRMLDPSLIRALRVEGSDAIGTCQIDEEEVPIYQLATLIGRRRQTKR